jgi:transaldolase
MSGLPSPQSHALDALRRYSTVVADTADFELLARYQPQEATTNPSLVLQMAQQAQHQTWIRQVLAKETKETKQASGMTTPADHMLVALAQQIAQRIPGRVSIEVDAHLAFDAQATVQKAKQLMALSQERGLNAKRLLIKLAATWEGIQAARVLEDQGMACNLTLVFSLTQAMACAHAGVSLISPFVGRVGDWHQKNGFSWADDPLQDPGVQLVHRIFGAYKTKGVKTQIMGASFRRSSQIRALAGCDLLTISPALLEELQNDTRPVERVLDPQTLQEEVPWEQANESQFRLALNENAMASEKLSEGLRLFTRDARLLNEYL